MPKVFADKNADAAMTRVEDAEFTPTAHKPLFIENAVSREEKLAVHMSEASAVRVEFDVRETVVDGVIFRFVKAEDEVDGPLHFSEAMREAVRQTFGSHRALEDSALKKVSAGCGFGKNREVDLLTDRLMHDLSYSVEVVIDLALPGFEVDATDAEIHARSLPIPFGNVGFGWIEVNDVNPRYLVKHGFDPRGEVGRE
jgi:hypothetical protein